MVSLCERSKRPSTLANTTPLSLSTLTRESEKERERAEVQTSNAADGGSSK